MSILKKLFGAGGGEAAKSEPETIEYKGYTITATPIAEGGQFRISARIDGVVNGEAKSHTLIRADVLRDAKEAEEASVGKAKQMIDQMGDIVFS